MVPNDSETERPTFEVGQTVVVRPDRAVTHAGERDTIAEIDHEDGLCRLETFGWYNGGDLELVFNGTTIQTTVNGEPANVVLDGKTGGVVENGDKQLALIRRPVDEITRALRDKSFELEREQMELMSRETAHTEQKAKVKVVQAQQNMLVVELREATKDDALKAEPPPSDVPQQEALDLFTEQVGDAEEVEVDGSWFERRTMRNPDTGTTIDSMTPIEKVPVGVAAPQASAEQDLDDVDPQ